MLFIVVRSVGVPKSLILLYYTQCTYHFFCFFFNDPATTEIYTLSLHDALPISDPLLLRRQGPIQACADRFRHINAASHPTGEDRKSTRLNSSHSQISYAVFCLKKKNKQNKNKI